MKITLSVFLFMFIFFTSFTFVMVESWSLTQEREEVAIITKSGYQMIPRIDGSWIVYVDETDSVYAYNLDSHQEITIASGSLAGGVEWAEIHDNKVVWSDTRSDDMGDIYMYDLETNKEQIICSYPGSQERPAIYGNIIVWQDWRSDARDIYMYDLDSETEIQISNDPADERNPVIFGDTIAWFTKGSDSLYGWYITTYNILSNEKRQIGDALSFPSAPDIFDDKLVYADLGRTEPSEDIFMYDLTSNHEFPICIENGGQIRPRIYSDKIVWGDLRNSNGKDEVEVFMYDLALKEEMKISSEPTTNRGGSPMPDVYGSKIVWSDERTGNLDIYLYDLTNPPSPATPSPDKWAVVIGVNDYEGFEFQFGAAESAEKMFNVLINDFSFTTENINKGFGVLADHILNWDDDISSDDVKEELVWLKDISDSQDTVLFYYAGHGARSGLDAGIEYLVAHDTSSPIPDYIIAKMLNEIECQTLIVILDMSYAGGFIRDNESWSDLALDSNRKPANNRIILAACGEVGNDTDEDTKALMEYNEMAFTHFLIEGFTEDENNDGKTSLEEAFRYSTSQFPTSDLWGYRKLLQQPQIYDGFSTFNDNSNEFILGDKVNDVESDRDALTVMVHSPVQLHLYDEIGQHVGVDKTGKIEYGLESSFLAINGSQIIIVPNPEDKYTVELVAINNGTFYLSSTRIEGKLEYNDTRNGTVIQDEIIQYDLEIENQKISLINSQKESRTTPFTIPIEVIMAIVVIIGVITIVVIALKARRKNGERASISL